MSRVVFSREHRDMNKISYRIYSSPGLLALPNWFRV